MDERGQAIGIFRLFLALGVGGVIFWIVSEVTTPLFDHAGDAGSDQVATTSTTYLQTGVEWLPVLFLFISLFGMVAYAVFSREMVGA